jgi:hypothetical protein
MVIIVFQTLLFDCFLAVLTLRAHLKRSAARQHQPGRQRRLLLLGSQVDKVIAWLTGYKGESLKRAIDAKVDLETFPSPQAPRMNPSGLHESP